MGKLLFAGYDLDAVADRFSRGVRPACGVTRRFFRCGIVPPK